MNCFAFARVPLFKLTPQSLRRQTLFPAKLILSQSAGFEFCQQPPDLLLRRFRPETPPFSVIPTVEQKRTATNRW
jgi:hypothetical protein